MVKHPGILHRRKLLLPSRQKIRRQNGVPGKERPAIRSGAMEGTAAPGAPARGGGGKKCSDLSQHWPSDPCQCLLSTDSTGNPEGKEAEMMPFFEVRYQHRGYKVDNGSVRAGE